MLLQQGFVSPVDRGPNRAGHRLCWSGQAEERSTSTAAQLKNMKAGLGGSTGRPSMTQAGAMCEGCCVSFVGNRRFTLLRLHLHIHKRR